MQDLWENLPRNDHRICSCVRHSKLERLVQGLVELSR